MVVLGYDSTSNAVKPGGGGPVVDLTARLTGAGIPVMAHVGLTPTGR